MGKRLILALVLALGLLWGASNTGLAQGEEPTQEPTPTFTPSPTATPGYLYEQDLEGNENASFLYRNEVTTGELMIFVGEVAIFILLFTGFAILIPRGFAKK